MQISFPPRNRSFGTVDALGLLGLLGLSIARWVPVARLIPFWGCTFRRLTGWPCPGCGLTRAADRFAHLHWLGALQANPLGTLAALGFAAMVVASAAHLLFAAPMPELVLSEKAWARLRWAMVGAFLLNYLFVVYAHRVLHLT